MPIAVRPDLSEENLQALLTEGHESETLDYKESCDINVNDVTCPPKTGPARMRVLDGQMAQGGQDAREPVHAGADC
jgi:hypothetical protein